MDRDIKVVVKENILRYMGVTNTRITQLKNQVGSEPVDRLLKGKTIHGCTLDTLQSIAQCLGVTVIDLVEDWG